MTVTVNTFLDELDGSIEDGDISLRDAIAAAPPGDIIDFDAALDGRTIVLTLGELGISKVLTIDATALPLGLTIDASGNDPTPDENNGDGSRVFDIDSSTTISGLTLTGGDLAGDGGAISAGNDIEIRQSTISGNAATGSGGAIALYEYCDPLSITITESTITGNVASADSGAIHGHSEYGQVNASVAQTTIADNTGRGILVNGDVTVTDSTISRNDGGGVSGGRIRGVVTITGSTISENSSHGPGGGIAGSDVTVSDSAVSGNTTSGDDNRGGGIYGNAVTVVTRSTISGNSATGGGGGIAGGDVTINSSTVSGNSSGEDGGAINGGDVTVANSNIVNNVALGSGYGGGVFSWGDSTITSSTLSGNSANFGGGVAHYGGPLGFGQMTITDSTISGNSAGQRGGGVWSRTSISLLSSTVTGNTAGTSGGGMYKRGNCNVGECVVQNSIISANSGNPTTPDLRLFNPSIAYSLIGDNTGTGLTEAPVGMPDANGNLIGDPNGVGIIDPLFDLLSDNGGPALTHALLPGSPALDAGDPGFTAPPDFDQRGSPFTRIAAGRIDMGAFEVQTLGDMDFNGDLDLDDIDDFVLGLSSAAAYQALYGVAPDTNGDTDGDGDLDFDDITGFTALLAGGIYGPSATTDPNVVPTDSFHVSPIEAGATVIPARYKVRLAEVVPKSEHVASLLSSRVPVADAIITTPRSPPRNVTADRSARLPRDHPASNTNIRLPSEEALAAIWADEFDWTSVYPRRV